MTHDGLCTRCHTATLVAASTLADYDHHGYCEPCARELARTALGSLVHYGTVPRALADLLEGELQDGEVARRLRRLGSLTYPPNRIVGVLVAISRRYADDTIKKHQEVLSRNGVVAFGKFLYIRQRPDDPDSVKPLSSLGYERHEGPAVGFFDQRARNWLSSGRPLHLFVLDPDPPATMWMGRVAQVAMRKSAGRRSDFAPPEFEGYAARDVVPAYYWLEPQKKQHLKYHCNYWFLIDSLEQISAAALLAMTDLETDGEITLATAQLYPAEVSLPAQAVTVISSRPPKSVPVSAGLGRVTIDFASLLRGLARVRVLGQAQEEMEKAGRAMVNQIADLAVRMERCGHDVRAMGIRADWVADASGLMEFYVGDASRVAAGWIANNWWLVGLSEAHPDDRFWQLMRRRWVELQLTNE